MSYLDEVIDSRPDKNVMAVFFGPGGVGKTTIGADAPKPIFIRTEKGTGYLKVKQFPDPKTFSDIIRMVDELLTSKHTYESVVIDSLDWAEPMCWAEVCVDMGIKTIGDAPYGKGYEAALNKWQVLLGKLKLLREKMHVILIAHSAVKKFSDPVQASEYDRFEIKLHAKTASLIKEAVDAVVFCTYEVFTKKDGQKTRAFGDGARVMFTQYRPSHDGKNRMGLPYQLPLSWEAFYQAVTQGPVDSLEILNEEINGMLGAIKDEKLKQTVVDTVTKAAGNIEQLKKIKNRLIVKLEA